MANPDQDMLDGLEAKHREEPGHVYAAEILEAKGIEYKRYLGQKA